MIPSSINVKSKISLAMWWSFNAYLSGWADYFDTQNFTFSPRATDATKNGNFGQLSKWISPKQIFSSKFNNWSLHFPGGHFPHERRSGGTSQKIWGAEKVRSSEKDSSSRRVWAILKRHNSFFIFPFYFIFDILSICPCRIIRYPDKTAVSRIWKIVLRPTRHHRH